MTMIYNDMISNVMTMVIQDQDEIPIKGLILQDDDDKIMMNCVKIMTI